MSRSGSISVCDPLFKNVRSDSVTTPNDGVFESATRPLQHRVPLLLRRPPIEERQHGTLNEQLTANVLPWLIADSGHSTVGCQNESEVELSRRSSVAEGPVTRGRLDSFSLVRDRLLRGSVTDREEESAIRRVESSEQQTAGDRTEKRPEAAAGIQSANAATRTDHKSREGVEGSDSGDDEKARYFKR